ncbi:MAG: hypothetical protein H6Q72_959 [Firmicutes bacterium]|nr:hypothetical protein [Bacillota bacterium]
MYDLQLSFTKQTNGTPKQTITDSAASTNVLNFGTKGAFYKPAYLHIRVVDAFESGTSGATLTAALQSDSAEAFSSAATMVTPINAVDHANLTAGYHKVIPFPIQDTEQYYRLYFTASVAMTAGSVVAYINDSPEL